MNKINVFTSRLELGSHGKKMAPKRWAKKVASEVRQ
jgi:hypothetical protein